MEDFINWGVPVQKRTAKEPIVEKYPDTAVITMSAEAEKGKSAKFILNTKAIEALNLQLTGEEFVSLAVVNGELKLSVSTGLPVPQYRITKSGSFSNKKMHVYIAKTLALDVTTETEFEVSTEVVEQNGVNIYSLIKL